jgi:hypothetical protein
MSRIWPEPRAGSGAKLAALSVQPVQHRTPFIESGGYRRGHGCRNVGRGKA